MNNILSDFPQTPNQHSDWPWSEITPPVAADQSYPKISVLTLSHNDESSLETTIRSVLLQGYPNLEYIIVDGGSSDGSLEIIQKYERWITHWSSLADPAQTLIDAFSKASGDILSQLRAGDLYTPDALHLAAKRLTGVSHGLLAGSTIVTNTPDSLDGEISSRWPAWEKIVYETDFFSHAGVFWTRDLWHSAIANFSSSPNLAIDYYLWLQMYFHASNFIPEAIVLSYSRTQPLRNDEHLARASIAAAAQRGESKQRFLLNLWLYRIRLALWKRKPKLVSGSPFHRAATRLILFPRRNNAMG